MMQPRQRIADPGTQAALAGWDTAADSKRKSNNNLWLSVAARRYFTLSSDESVLGTCAFQETAS